MALSSTHTRTAPQPEPAPQTAQPCNPRISHSIDRVIVALDNDPQGVRRHALLAAKRLLEMAIPAYEPEVR